MHCVDLGESFPTSAYLQNLASIQPRTSLVKFARSPRTGPPGKAGKGGKGGKDWVTILSLPSPIASVDSTSDELNKRVQKLSNGNAAKFNAMQNNT